MKRIISNFLFFKVLGWKMIGHFPKDLKKCVILGAPHTSWQDFVLGLFFKNIQGITLNFVGKKALFDSFFGFYFRALGGIPVDRSKKVNLVDSLVKACNSREVFRLAISPEGTREKTNDWKTGFYYIAKGANIPVVMMTFDFGKKQIAISEPYFTTDDKEKDFSFFHKFYEGIVGKNPRL